MKVRGSMDMSSYGENDPASCTDSPVETANDLRYSAHYEKVRLQTRETDQIILNNAARSVYVGEAVLIPRPYSDTIDSVDYPEDEDYYAKKKRRLISPLGGGEGEEEGCNDTSREGTGAGTEESVELIPERCMNCEKQFVKGTDSLFCSGECSSTYIIRTEEVRRSMRRSSPRLARKNKRWE